MAAIRNKTIFFYSAARVWHAVRSFRLKIAPSGREWSTKDSSFWRRQSRCSTAQTHYALVETSSSRSVTYVGWLLRCFSPCGLWSC